MVDVLRNAQPAELSGWRRCEVVLLIWGDRVIRFFKEKSALLTISGLLVFFFFFFLGF